MLYCQHVDVLLRSLSLSIGIWTKLSIPFPSDYGFYLLTTQSYCTFNFGGRIEVIVLGSGGRSDAQYIGHGDD
jgi:hypothetical protein